MTDFAEMARAFLQQVATFSDFRTDLDVVRYRDFRRSENVEDRREESPALALYKSLIGISGEGWGSYEERERDLRSRDVPSSRASPLAKELGIGDLPEARDAQTEAEAWKIRGQEALNPQPK